MFRKILHTQKSEKNKENNPLYRFTLTCQSGLESLVRRDAQRLGLTEIAGQDRLIFGSGNLETLYRLLIGSRFANRVYIDCTPGGEPVRITDFDALYELLAHIRWGDFLTGREQIIIEASSTRSRLTSLPHIQSVAQKAIFSTLYTPNNAHAVEVHILILLVDDFAHILLDVTGDPLHKRGYRQEGGEAPIKENLASALLIFSGWKYRDTLIDPFCGSGTIVIEAAMMARNIPPGLQRHFRVESLPFHDGALFASTKENMRSAIFTDCTYSLRAYDRDPLMIEKAKRNAERAGVAQDIVFSVADFYRSDFGDAPYVLVTNPPYGKRLDEASLEEIYEKLTGTLQNQRGGYITNYPVWKKYLLSQGAMQKNTSQPFYRGNARDREEDHDIHHFSLASGLANKKLLNGGEECRFWYRKPTH